MLYNKDDDDYKGNKDNEKASHNKFHQGDRIRETGRVL